VNEIAEKLKTSHVSVQSSLSRARKAFKDVIDKMMQNDEFNIAFLEN
jgi:DNA-directed RNA polymerase specialized sigma24 family protein